MEELSFGILRYLSLLFVSSYYFVTLRAKPPLVFFLIEGEKRRLCMNSMKPLKSPQPKPLDQGFSQKGVKPSYGRLFLEEIRGKFT